MQQDEAVEAEIRQLLSEGQKLGAIKRYRELTGLGLREAKDAVEALERGEAGVDRKGISGLTEDLVHGVTKLLQEGRTIEAIKVCREQTGLGLRESKLMVEQIGQKMGIEVSGAGCLGVVLAICGVSIWGLASYVILS